MKKSHFFHLAISCPILLAIFALVSTTGTVQAQSVATNQEVSKPTPQEKPANDSDDDEQLDDSFRKFGRAAGAAYQCVPDAEKERVVHDVMRAYTRIGQLFGTDRSFYFAAAFGNASDAPFDKAKCPELIKKLRESVLVSREARK